MAQLVRLARGFEFKSHMTIGCTNDTKEYACICMPLLMACRFLHTIIYKFTLNVFYRYFHQDAWKVLGLTLVPYFMLCHCSSALGIVHI